MFKVLVLQRLNNLSDDRIEYQIRDRFSFMRFLGLELEDYVPDARTVWVFRERLKELELVDVLFAGFHEQLAVMGLFSRPGRCTAVVRHLDSAEPRSTNWGIGLEPVQTASKTMAPNLKQPCDS